MAKTTPWLLIKKEYLQGITPKELSVKYKIKAKQISDKANEEKWVDKKKKISENIREQTEEYIKNLTRKALNALEDIISSPDAMDKDKVAAAKAVLDVSGLKISKQELTGKDGQPIVQKEYIFPEEIKEFEKHLKATIGKKE